MASRIAPPARLIIAITSPFLLLRASVASFCARAGCGDFLLGRGCLSLFLALAARFFWLAPRFEGAFSDKVRPIPATAAALALLSAFVM
jgi:hypothetical protein